MTGYSGPELASATVVTPSGTLVDGLAAVLMVMGSEEGSELVV
jgi:thiamine biosynthesis lipoprotein ApbE